jgi:WhiB family redox-sensing transcriptional regulator
MPSPTNSEYDRIRDEILADPHAWRDYARCLGATEEEQELIFPWGRPEPTQDQTDAFIREHCVECPVRQQCLDFAAKTESIGIWGGFRIEPRHAAKLKELRDDTGRATVEDARTVLGKEDP